MNCPYMIGYSAVIRDNPCDCPFSETTRSEHHPLDDLTGGFTVKYIGGVYPNDEYTTDGIDNDRTFSARNEFAPVKS